MDLKTFRQHLIPDDIDEKTPPVHEESFFLSTKKLAFVSAWAGNLAAAARAAGYKNPRDAAYKLMKDPEVVKALQKKQESMLQESGEHLARTLPLSRADIIDRLWQLAQLSPGATNNNITGQVKAAQALEEIFALNIDRNELLKRQLAGKSEAEMEFFVIHGFLPHQEEKPTLVAPTGTPQLPESIESTTSTASTADSGTPHSELANETVKPRTQ